MLTLIHTLHDAIEVRHRGDDGAEVALCRYVYAPRMPARESPKPYLHPLRTLAGRIVTAYRPHDHVWHKGLMLTSAQLSGQNFWGGPTFVRDRGYVQLDNNGRVEHREWAQLASEEQRATLDERLAWIAADGEEWIAEERTITVAEVAAAEGYWSLDFATRLRNLRASPLVFGSPTTEGRPLAGYGGLFWRGPRSFLGGQILAGDLEGPGVMGQPAPWLAFIGQHDEEDATSTLLFLDHPDNPRYPTKWFVRNDPFACASFAFSFDEEFILPPGATLEQRYRIVIADGEWPRERIAAYAARYPDAPSPRDRLPYRDNAGTDAVPLRNRGVDGAAPPLPARGDRDRWSHGTRRRGRWSAAEMVHERPDHLLPRRSGRNAAGDRTRRVAVKGDWGGTDPLRALAATPRVAGQMGGEGRVPSAPLGLRCQPRRARDH